MQASAKIVVRRERVPRWVFHDLDGRHFRDYDRLRRAMLPLIKQYRNCLPPGAGPAVLINALRALGFLFEGGLELWVSTRGEPEALARKPTFWRELGGPGPQEP